MFVVFTDFQCPFCATVAALLRELVKRHPDDVIVYVKNYPLRMHVHAELAAEASLCANAQGKYPEFHDLLFSNQNSLDESALIRFAGLAGCDTAAFASCLRSGFHKQFIARDIAEAGKNGITGTPTVFLNGRPLLGDLSLEQLEAELQALRR
jgi:protein-disulfide isomerase